MFQKSHSKTKQRAAPEHYGQQPRRAVEDGEEAGSKAAEYADENCGDECRNGSAQLSEKLHGDPEHGKSKERT